MKNAVIIYFIVMNILGILLMERDKSKAKRNAFRIPEKSLFFCSILGGSIGIWAGMYLFRHKTKHWYFVMGIPLVLVLQMVIVIFLNLSV